MRIKVTTHAPHLSPNAPRPPGIGTRIKEAIARTVDGAPIPGKLKRAIKGCAGCGRRADALDRADAAVRRAIGLDGKPKSGQ